MFGLGHVEHGEGHRDVDKGSHQADQQAVQIRDEIPLIGIFFRNTQRNITQICTAICQMRDEVRVIFLEKN